jgi:hypothetical protein
VFEIEADLKFSAAAYLRSLAAPDKDPDKKTAALSKATTQTREAPAESRIAAQPTVNTYEAPPARQEKRIQKKYQKGIRSRSCGSPGFPQFSSY